jgi:integrase
MADIFDTFLKTEASIETYRFIWNSIQKTLNKSEDKLLALPPKELEKQVIEYVSILKKENKAPTTIQLRLTAFEFVCSMNDILLNWKKLKKMIPEKIKPTGSETWKDQDIRNMVKHAGSKRNITIVYCFASLGPRVQALADVKIKDITFIEDCTLVMLYAGTPYEYPAFITPEGTKALKHYLDSRDNLTPESPLLAHVYDNGKHLSVISIQAIMIRILSKFPNSRKKINPKVNERYNIQITHGFRKWQATKLKLKIDVHHSISERLLGHKAGLDSNYFVTHGEDARKQLFEAFKKCIPDLTLDKSEMIEEVQANQKKLADALNESRHHQKALEELVFALQNGNPIKLEDPIQNPTS